MFQLHGIFSSDIKADLLFLISMLVEVKKHQVFQLPTLKAVDTIGSFSK